MLFSMCLLIPFALLCCAVQVHSWSTINRPKDVFNFNKAKSRAIKRVAVAVAALQLTVPTHPKLAFADAIPAVGTPAPDFSLPSNAGKDISLKDLAGKRTVLYFYPVCPPNMLCNAFFHYLARLASSLVAIFCFCGDTKYV